MLYRCVRMILIHADAQMGLTDTVRSGISVGATKM